jgi:hypothetical protein
MEVITDSTLRELLASLSPADKAILYEAIREGAEWKTDAKDILRWLRRKLKRRVRARKPRR